jgi:hypothetical protein
MKAMFLIGGLLKFALKTQFLLEDEKLGLEGLQNGYKMGELL